MPHKHRRHSPPVEFIELRGPERRGAGTVAGTAAAHSSAGVSSNNSTNHHIRLPNPLKKRHHHHSNHGAPKSPQSRKPWMLSPERIRQTLKFGSHKSPNNSSTRSLLLKDLDEGSTTSILEDSASTFAGKDLSDEEIIMLVLTRELELIGD